LITFDWKSLPGTSALALALALASALGEVVSYAHRAMLQIVASLTDNSRSII
jgi:hypothetical protein